MIFFCDFGKLLLHFILQTVTLDQSKVKVAVKNLFQKRVEESWS